MGTIRYYPMKIKHNRLHEICSMTYPTKEEAFNYAISRGLKESEIITKELIYYDDSWDTHIKFNDIDDDIE